ncbi:MAG: hypothetical protein CMI26_08355 [Opitutae bacterium]|nr:hypothetical protein [Opitutae bacterium]
MEKEMRLISIKELPGPGQTAAEQLPSGLHYAVVTERGGRRCVHRAVSASSAIETGSPATTMHQQEVSLPIDEIAAEGTQIMLCVINEKTGGLSSMVRLDPDHLLMHPGAVERDVCMYTCDYVNEIETMVRPNDHATRAAQRLVDLRVTTKSEATTATTTTAVTAAKDLYGKVKARVYSYNAACEAETKCLLKLHKAMSEKLKRHRGGQPLVELVDMRGPVMQKATLVNEGTVIRVSDDNDSAPAPLDYFVPRSLYFSYVYNAPSALSTEFDTMERFHDGGPLLRALDNVSMTRNADELLLTLDAEVPNAFDRAEIKEWNARTIDVATTAAVSTTGAEGRAAAAAMVRGRSLMRDIKDVVIDGKGDAVAHAAVQEFFDSFQPLSHGDYDALSLEDPYCNDKCFLPRSRDSESLLPLKPLMEVDRETYYNLDCETEAGRCAARECMLHQAVRGCLHCRAGEGERGSESSSSCFVNTVLSLATLATFPVQGLVQCSTRSGGHVVHGRFAPQESWAASSSSSPSSSTTMKGAYHEGLAVRSECRELLQSIIDDNHHSSFSPSSSKRSADDILSTVQALYRHKAARVQDCTVSEKTSNGFAFYDKLRGIYFCRADGTLQRTVPTQRALRCGRASFQSTLDAMVEDPARCVVDCDSEEVRDLVQCNVKAFRDRVGAMRGCRKREVG